MKIKNKKTRVGKKQKKGVYVYEHHDEKVDSVYLANLLLFEINKISGSTYYGQISTLDSFADCVRHICYCGCGKQDKGELLMFAIYDNSDYNVEIHNVKYGLSLYVPSRYESLVEELTVLN
ncbi:hypothetical protein [Sphingobacterium sp.]|uniref:hypothetical protein n=1 Tax=Sphingobacterium sp. TaxID=341027 RepID=UPI0028A95A87|nr:hypothetical protein [Sphingobacterium sp.]